MKPVLFVLALSGLLIGHRNLTQFSPGDSKRNLGGSPSPTISANVAAAARSRILASFGKLPLSFELNQGQADARVNYLARGAGYTLFLTPTEAVLSLPKELSRKMTASAQRDAGASGTEILAQRSPHGNLRFATLRIGFQGANPTPRVIGLDKVPGKSNYLIGSDPANWHTEIPTFARVEYESLYPGIDLIYHGEQGQVEYDFVVAPGASPSTIRLNFADAKKLYLSTAGDLVLITSAGEIQQRKPRIYQEAGGVQKRISGRYLIDGHNQLRFGVASYDVSKPLIIDPSLVYSTQLGGTHFDEGFGVTVDSNGNAYVTGQTNSVDFPVTPGAFQNKLGGNSCVVFNSICGDAFITKLDAAGTALVYSTYLGGSDNDQGSGIAVDSAGNAFVAGATSSANFPVTPGGFQTRFNGSTCMQGVTAVPCTDAFLTELNSTGTALLYSTYLGGSGNDQGNGIALDPNGGVYVTGSAGLPDFPTTPGSIETTFKNPGAVFVSKINPTLSGIPSLVYSTFLGGSTGFDFGTGIAVNSAGEAYVTGQMRSPGLGTPGSFEPVRPAAIPAFVARLNATGTALIFGTYLGGNNISGCASDQGNAIALDATGNAYITGRATTSDFPTTPGAFQRNLSGIDDVFVTKLKADGSALMYSTLLGGSASNTMCMTSETASGIALDSLGDAYVTGITASRDFPITPITLQTVCNPLNTPSDTCAGFVTILNPTGSSLLLSTYIGPPIGINSIAVDSAGNAYVTGSGKMNFPTIPGFSTVGGAFLTKINPAGTAPAAGLFPQGLAFNAQAVGTTSPPQTATLTNRGNAPLTVSNVAITGEFAETDTCKGVILPPAQTCTINVTFTPLSSGLLSGQVTVTDSAFDSPHFVQLTGGGGNPMVSLSTSSLTFGPQNVGTTSAFQTVTMTNPGNANLSITSIAVTGDFAQTNDCGSTLNATISCTIKVSFTPTATGTRSGTLTLTDNAANSPQIVLLAGTGGNGNPSFTFGSPPPPVTVAAGHTAMFSVTVIPASGFTQSVSLSCSGAPRAAMCSVPASVTLNGIAPALVTASVTTMARASAAPKPQDRYLVPFPNGPAAMPMVTVVLTLIVVCGLAIARHRRVWSARALLPCVGLLLVFLLSSCGGGSSGGGGASSGTPAGTYTLTVTATFTSGGNTTTQNVNLTLVVQ